MSMSSEKIMLEQIEQDRLAELERIREACEQEIRRVRRQAYASSLALHREVVARTRQELADRRQRYLSRTRARIRPLRWRALESLADSIAEKVRLRMLAAWQDSEQQWTWCRYWLQEANRLKPAEPLRVIHHDSLRKENLARIRAWPDNAVADTDASLETAGLKICWGAWVLDGTLEAQMEAVRRRAHDRLTPVMPHFSQESAGNNG